MYSRVLQNCLISSSLSANMYYSHSDNVGLDMTSLELFIYGPKNPVKVCN